MCRLQGCIVSPPYHYGTDAGHCDKGADTDHYHKGADTCCDDQRNDAAEAQGTNGCPQCRREVPEKQRVRG